MLEQKERIEDRVERSMLTGVRNRWWCIGPSAMVGDWLYKQALRN